MDAKEPEETEKIDNVAGVILAGGKSSRYGENKAFVEVGGVPLIERVIRVMRSLFRDLILITNTPEEYARLNLPMHSDLIKGLGPLGGIYTALTVLTDEAGFFAACDMPSLNRDLIAYIVRQSEGFDAVVPRMSGRIEALHALYHKRCLNPIKGLIDSGEYQVFRFLDEVAVRYVDESEIRRFDPRFLSFYNINRPQELQNFIPPNSDHEDER